MAGRDPPRGLDPDDWFAGAGQASPRSSGGTTTPAADHDSQSGEAEDWLDDRPLAAGRDRVLASLKGNRRLAVAGGVIVVVVLLVVGLLVGGVFSGGGGNRATTSTTTPVTTTTQTSPHTATPASTPAPTTTLKPGDTGAQVKVLQRALARLGYASGAVDGDYGPATQAAVKRFQTAAKLAPDGVVGPKTLAALKQALLAQG
jgi:putative peptidoglycan binding protein